MTDDNTAELARAIDTLRSRRAVLRGAATAGLAGICAPLLAACGGSDDAGGTPSSSGSSSAPTSAPTSGTPSAGGGGEVLGPVSDIPVGGGKIFTDAKIVVTQPTAGQFKGFSAVCTHAGNPVGSIQDGKIVCPFHGSRFNIADGSVANGPATNPLPAVAVTVKSGEVVASA